RPTCGNSKNFMAFVPFVRFMVQIAPQKATRAGRPTCGNLKKLWVLGGLREKPFSSGVTDSSPGGSKHYRIF
ncbi:MAG: hypothetical protein SGI98_01405, partial [Verrucomicrobiota bacterium]|nr:hypothetical protein [Verrucomicrobiota bacterium]